MDSGNCADENSKVYPFFKHFEHGRFHNRLLFWDQLAPGCPLQNKSVDCPSLTNRYWTTWVDDLLKLNA